MTTLELSYPRRYGWRVRMAAWLLTVGCRHEQGTICRHRQWLYDVRSRAYGEGMAAGARHAETEQRGQPPYDDHPCLRCGRLDCNDVNAIIAILHAPEVKP